jgi:hypothetical protein
MIKRVLKIFGVIIGAIIIYIVGITIWLYSMIHYYEESKDSVPLSELPKDFVTDVDLIRNITQCQDLPEFEARKLWYHKMDGYHSEPHIDCYFKRKMTEDEFKNLFKMTENIYWDSDKDWTLSFSRGWSKKEYMDVPEGMKEDIAVKIEKLSQTGFTLSYWKNVNSRPIDCDSLNMIAEMILPSYSVVSYISDIDNIRAKLRFNNASKNIADVFPNGSEEIKIDTFVNGKWYIFSMYRDEKYADLRILSSRHWCGNGIIK